MAVIPLIIHLILRQKPRRLVFPALRLIRLRHQVNLRKLRLRHWLLMALRMLLIALMALALARPSIHGASFIPDQQAPMAAALVFDTSLSMQYRQRDRSRLQEAQEIASELLKELPGDSEVLVLQSAESAARVFPDIALARRRVESLRLRPGAGSLNRAIIEACRALNESTLVRKEMFIFTDLAAGSLDPEGADELQAALRSVVGGVGLYIQNVAATERENRQIASVELSAGVVPAGSEVFIAAVVQDDGRGGESVIELELDGERRGSWSLSLPAGGAERAEFPLRGLAPGLHQGKLVLSNGGGLAFDDVHYLTIEVRPVTKVLIVSDQWREAANLVHALAPPKLVEQQRARYDCGWVATERIATSRLEEFSLVFLVNVTALSGANWQRLERFVRSGGGLGVFLGNRIEPDNYNLQIAQSLLPARIGPIVSPPETVSFAAVLPGHPAVRKLHAWNPAALGQIIVERFWECELSGADARRVVNFSNNSLAVADRMLGGNPPGRVLLCTTSVGPSPQGRPWNDLPQSSAQFVILSDGIAAYLAGYLDSRLNFQAGEDVVIRPEEALSVGAYLLHTPDSEQPTRRTADPDQGALVVSAPDALGNYSITASIPGGTLDTGFSVNAGPEESRLEQLTESQRDALLGEQNYAVARSLDELHEAMGDVRIGRELYPWLMLLVVVIFAAEHVLANRFYQQG